MHTIEIPDRNFSFQLPSEWDECTQEQTRFILNKAFDVMEGTTSICEFRIHIFIYLTGLKFGSDYLIKNELGMARQINERIYQLSHNLCDWVFSKNEADNYELTYESVVNSFPIIGDMFYGPQDMLADVSLGEFKNALAALDQYFDSKEIPEEAITHLDHFLGVLYRRLDEKGNRLPFLNYMVDSEPFRSVSLWQKQSIIIWFSYCVKCLQSEDVVIDGIECNFQVLFPKSTGTTGNSTKVNLGWTGILMDIAESGVFGDAINTSKTSLYEILLYLLKKHQDQPKQK